MHGGDIVNNTLGNRQKDHEKAVNEMMERLNLPEKDCYYVDIMLRGTYQLGRSDAKEEILNLIKNS